MLLILNQPHPNKNNLKTTHSNKFQYLCHVFLEIQIDTYGFLQTGISLPINDLVWYVPNLNVNMIFFFHASMQRVGLHCKPCLICSA